MPSGGTSCLCQTMVFGINSTSIGSPSLGCNEGGNVIHSNCKQRRCDTAWLWGGPQWGASQTALLCSTPATLFQWHVFSVWGPAGETQSSVFRGKGKCTTRGKEELSYRERSPCPWSLIGPSLCKCRLQILSLIASKSTILIAWNGASLIGWWRC